MASTYSARRCSPTWATAGEPSATPATVPTTAQFVYQVHDLDRINAQCVAQPRGFVGEGDLQRVEVVAAVLHHLGGTHRGSQKLAGQVAEEPFEPRIGLLGIGADDRERRQLQGYGGGTGPLAHDDIDSEVLHREIQHLLGGARHAVDLVDEEHLAGRETAEQRCECETDHHAPTV